MPNNDDDRYRTLLNNPLKLQKEKGFRDLGALAQEFGELLSRSGVSSINDGTFRDFKGSTGALVIRRFEHDAYRFTLMEDPAPNDWDELPEVMEDEEEGS